MNVNLSLFNNSSYDTGRSFFVRTIWHFINAVLLQSPLNPSSKLKIIILRLFGAKVGTAVMLKPSINIKYPWKLEIGDYSWIGENAWFDTLAHIKIGSHVCISQGAYLCTGNHDYTKEAFDLIVKPIIIEDGVWVGAKAIICPGVTLGSHSVITVGSVVTHDTEPYTIYQGNAAKPIHKRVIF